MLSANLIREARLRAGLTQRELAARLGRPQSSIARWEAGMRRPSLEALVEIVRACDLELTFGMAAYDTSHDAFIWELLDLPPAERLAHQVARAISVLRLIDAQGEERPGKKRFDPLPVLEALGRSGLRYVLIGRLAENLRGSPYLPLDGEVAICPSPDDGQILEQALNELGAEQWVGSRDYALELPRDRKPYRDANRWALRGTDITLAAVDAPAGTGGYADLRRQANYEDLGVETTIAVTALVDLIRIADASPWSEDGGTISALRRTLELAEDYKPPDERPVVVPKGLEELFAEHGIAAA